MSEHQNSFAAGALLILSSLLAGALIAATVVAQISSNRQRAVSKLAATPTPYPTPKIDPGSYLPPTPKGRIVRVSRKGGDLAALIQAAQDRTDVATVSVEGGGSITKQVVLKHHTIFDAGTYSCDVEGITDYGVFQIADNVLVEGKGTTILEPTYHSGQAPAIEVFQAQGDSCCSHEGSSHDIAVVGFHIKGRQTVYDGGVRSTILLGNCRHCTAQNNSLEDTGSIGIELGGNAAKGNFAQDCLIWRNTTSGVAAANIAVVNAESVFVIENKVLRPGHHNPRFGGGVAGFDLETNTPLDHAKNIYVLNNFFDYEDAAFDGVGSAIALQDPYSGKNSGNVVVANNRILGGRTDAVHRYMTSGIFITGELPNLRIVNNYIFKTGQAAIQMYGGGQGALIQDNQLDSTGGGGAVAIELYDVTGATLRRNNMFTQPNIPFSTAAGIKDCGRANVFDNNFSESPGSEIRPSSQGCPQKAPRKS